MPTANVETPISFCSSLPLSTTLACVLLVFGFPGFSNPAIAGAKTLAQVDEALAANYVWISANAALDSEGDVRHECFPHGGYGRKIDEEMQGERPREQWVRDLENEECKTHRIMTNDAPYIHLAAEFISEATVIVEGRITGVEPGFDSTGTAGSLLTIEIKDIINETAEFRIADNLYLYYPWSRFAIHDTHFCQGHLPGEYRIEPGDRVLVVSHGRGSVHVPAFRWAHAAEVIFEDSDDGMVFNGALEQLLMLYPDGPEIVSILDIWGTERPSLSTLAETLRGILARDPTSAEMTEP